MIAAAQAAGVPIRGDVDLFAELVGRPRRSSAITGTNGKSTTTALIHHLLGVAGIDAVLGGNIGRPVLELEPGPPERVFVLELSSFQLDLCERLRCRVAVWLNLTPDHLDRHGDLAGYIAAKERIFGNQEAGDVAVVGIDDAPSRELAQRLRALGREVVTVALGETTPADDRRSRRLAGRSRRSEVARSARPRQSARPAQLAERRRGLRRRSAPSG